MAIFFSAATAAGAFVSPASRAPSLVLTERQGGLLAFGISGMDHTAGLRSWQWIFILEGIATLVVGRLRHQRHLKLLNDLLTQFLARCGRIPLSARLSGYRQIPDQRRAWGSSASP
jgi:hypothetical protein